jgi:hypothetical protein
MIVPVADMLTFDRLQFAATITFHYLFPQLTMGLAVCVFHPGHERLDAASCENTIVTDGQRVDADLSCMT